MTREEAIRILDRRTTIPGDGFDFEQINKAIDIAIEALRGPKVKTNADHIRAMGDKELAEWLCSISTGECCERSCPARELCKPGSNGMREWVKEPYIDLSHEYRREDDHDEG